ncbi:MAG TPA: restriction endonuclease subunit S, partial [Pyrinomonadaceae bacterium]|nr:restriction endonuclease subunit S [Pyrinomonadaceae bacterium]
MNTEEKSNENLSNGWQILPLFEIAKVCYGKAKPKIQGEIPVIGSGGIYGFTEKPLVDYETIVIGRKGSAGATYYCEKPSYPSDTTFYLEWKRKVDVPFVYNFLKFQSLVSDNSVIPSLQRETVENF